MDFKIIGDVTAIEPIAVGQGIRHRRRLRKVYGKGRWRKLRGIATVRLVDGTIHTAEVHWYEAHGNWTEGVETKTSAAGLSMTKATRFAVCTDNKGYAASLSVGKLYPLIPDGEAARHGYFRVIDETGEDYAHAAKRFFVLRVPEALARTLGPRRPARVHTSRALQGT